MAASAGKDYYPFRKGLRRRYRSESAAGLSSITTEILSVTSSDGRTVARVRQDVEFPDKPPRSTEYDVLRDSRGVYRYKEKELSFPLEIGGKWAVEGAEYEVNSMRKSVEVPAGLFKGCLQVLYLVSGGDAGGGEIYYAPDLGLIKHVSHDESEPFRLELVRYSRSETRLPGSRPRAQPPRPGRR